MDTGALYREIVDAATCVHGALGPGFLETIYVRALLAELRAYPGGTSLAADSHGGVAVPLVLRAGDGLLSFLSTTTMFGTPIDITLAELAIEAFLPADAETARMLIGEG